MAMKTVRFRHRTHTVERFTNGECGALAEAIHQRTGWPICMVSNRPTGVGFHAVVQVPDGRYLDIEGLWTFRALLARWSHGDAQIIWHVDQKRWESHFPAWHPPHWVTAAAPFARRVIANAKKHLNGVAA